MEGIRGVGMKVLVSNHFNFFIYSNVNLFLLLNFSEYFLVEETGARIDDDTETSPLTEVNHSSTLWSIATSITETISHDLNDSSTVNQQDLQNRVDTEVTDNIKKKKINKTRKTQSK